MASEIQKHVERMARIGRRMERMGKIRDTPLRLMVACNDGYMRPVVEVTSNGHIEFYARILGPKKAREVATWILEMHAGHVDAPPTDEKEEA